MRQTPAFADEALGGYAHRGFLGPGVRTISRGAPRICEGAAGIYQEGGGGGCRQPFCLRGSCSWTARRKKKNAKTLSRRGARSGFLEFKNSWHRRWMGALQAVFSLGHGPEKKIFACGWKELFRCCGRSILAPAALSYRFFPVTPASLQKEVG